MKILLIFLGGGLGAVFRHVVVLTAGRFFGVGFPWGVLIVNASGGLAMGLLAGWLSSRPDSARMIGLFFGTGLLGGFTTFSAFSLDAFRLWERGETWAAFFYVAASVVSAIGGVAVGFRLMKGFTS